MKYLLTTLPLAAVLIGCGPSASDNSTANATDVTPAATETTSTDNAATNSASADPAATGAPEDTAQPTSANDSGADYTVIDEANPGMPPEAVAALKKVKVPPPPKSMKAPDNAVLTINTSKGPITVRLDGKAAPLHVKSFIYLAKRGFYNGTIWHRYEPGFVIQGGDPLTKFPKLSEFYGTGGPGYQVPREYNDLKHEQYVIAMARSSDPNSAGSQFYFTLEAAPFLDEGDGYTVFGKVTSGQKAVAALRKGDKLTSIKVVSQTP